MKYSARCDILTAAKNYTQNLLGIDTDCKSIDNIIATGHQAIWHHCGIWAKDVAVCRFAKLTRGTALHLILDHDICDTAVVLPEKEQQDYYSFRRFKLEENPQDIPLEFRTVPDVQHIIAFINELCNTNQRALCSNIWPENEFISRYKNAYINNIADVLSFFQSSLNISMGYDMIYLPVSRLCQSDAFLEFAALIIKDAMSFAQKYNDAVSQQNINTGSSQKSGIQKLKVKNTAKSAEIPFWLVSADGTRKTLCVAFRNTDSAVIGTESAEASILALSSISEIKEQLKEILRDKCYRLRPKAITLTLFSRLFLSDLFIHGTGAAAYEAMTDYLIENYFCIKRLDYATATANMVLPLQRYNDTPEISKKQMKQILHKIKHNPEIYVRYSITKENYVMSLIKAKKDIIAQTKNRSISQEQRKSAWNTLTKINVDLYKYAKGAVNSIESQIVSDEQRQISEDVCSYREFFFGLFPEDLLRRLSDTLQ